MPPQTTKEFVREAAVAKIQGGLGALQMQTQPSPDQSTSANPDFSQLYHIPGASMHEILYTNGDNAPTPDRVVIPKQACGELTTKEAESQAHSGVVPGHPLHERYDNYGNRWLEGGFEYPPYEGRLTSAGMGSDDMSAEVHGPQMPSDRGTTGDEPTDYTIETEQNGTATIRKASESPTGPGDSGGHSGSRSDKWPAIGLTNFKPGARA